MRTFIKLTGIASVLAVAACSGKTGSNDEFQKDLERAATASDIALPSAQPATQVVSSIERTTPPAPRRIARSQRVAKRKPAPANTPAPVEVEQATRSDEIQVAATEPAPAPVQQATLPTPRPQPVSSSGGDYGDGGIGRGRGNIGTGIGTVIGVVLRGAVVDGDDCDPRSEDRRRRGRGATIVINNPGTISVNNRIPITGTFPGSGRIAGGSANLPTSVLGGVGSIGTAGSIGRRGRF